MTENATAVDDAVATPVTDVQIRIWKLRGLSDAAIARRAGCSRQAISKRLKKIWARCDRKTTEKYRQHEALLIDDTKRLVLHELRNPARLKSASFRDLTINFGVLFDKGQLAKGQSTANVQLHVLVEEIEKRRRATTRSAAALNDANPAPQVPVIADERA